MAHEPVSVIVTAPDWAAARACVSRLRTGVRDEVIVAIADEFAIGGADKAGLDRSVRAVVGPAHTVTDDATALARHDLHVYLDATLLPTGHWLDALIGALADPSVAHAGPRIADAAGDQHADVPSGLHGDARRQFAREWASARRGEITDTDALDPRCVATRRSMEAGRRVIVHEAFVDVPAAAAAAAANGSRGGATHTGPLLSACIITKDEEANIGRCLASLTELVDEIVVYDTGSFDATVEIARRAGAVVIEGEWRDDFAAARNAALTACTSEWILWVDADEVVTGDPAAFRAVLAGNPEVDEIQVFIDNVEAESSAIDYSHETVKVFRRLRGEWEGRLHETVVPRAGQRDLRRGYTAHIRFLHAGYRKDELVAKSERNIRLAEAELADGTRRRSLVLIHLGRSLIAAGRLEEALARFEEALDRTDKAGERRLALRHGAEALLDLGEATRAREWIARLREVSDDTDMADYLDAIALAELDDAEGALALLAPLRLVRDEEGFVIPDHTLRFRRALLYANAEQWDEASEDLLAIVTDDTAPPWGMLAEVHFRAGRDLREVAAVIPGSQLTAAMAQILAADPAAADAVAEELYARWGDDAAVLAGAAALAPQLRVERALEWSARLRKAGLANRCPLLAIAHDDERAPLERVQAVCLTHGAFGADDASDLIATVAVAVPVDGLLDALMATNELAPALLPRFVMGAATDTERTLALADILESVGAADVAGELRTHAK